MLFNRLSILYVDKRYDREITTENSQLEKASQLSYILEIIFILVSYSRIRLM